MTVINDFWLATATHCFIGAYDLQDFYIAMDLQYRTDLYSSEPKFIPIEELVHQKYFHSVKPGEVLHINLILIRVKDKPRYLQ